MNIKQAIESMLKAGAPSRWRSSLKRRLFPAGGGAGILDLREIASDPVEAVYISRGNLPVIDAALHHCRGFSVVGMPFEHGKHPFIQTIRSFSEGFCDGYPGSPLESYYETFQPRNAFEALGISPPSGPLPRGFESPFAAVFPWWPDVPGIRPEDRVKNIRRTAASDYKGAGLAAPKDAVLPWFGPFDRELGNLEFIRLSRLHRSLVEKGFQRDATPDGDIRASVLVNSSFESRFLITSGQHRAAAASSIGLKTIPVRLVPTISKVLIRRDDVDYWPFVRSNLFSREQALEIFDRVFEGVPSSDRLLRR